ncbi:hypothetical protein CUMW_112660 [Citrus unshiu]|nr:hypothetical protein CUMW_112660 [Citrus unshiu]
MKKWVAQTSLYAKKTGCVFIYVPRASLEGKKLASFTRISSIVQSNIILKLPLQAAMEEALVRILTPRRSIDILRDVHAAKEQRKPYVVVFVGVNGVGKSTNLAKVAYWLLQHKVSVMMAACDTFRSGAVEQLRTHARRLQVPIFEKGYEKDPAIVAKEAIQEATRNGSDVVLVDTAGRMQDNEPLMRALSKLIYLNNPDLVLFVGEALVGNDAVDQLSKFNQKLADLSSSPNPQLIDGILLTKFDTIDDKVGAALSMVYVSGAPVMFVGCGQSYTDLKKLNVKSISLGPTAKQNRGRNLYKQMSPEKQKEMPNQPHQLKEMPSLENLEDLD